MKLPEYENVTFSLPWYVTCRIACLALIQKTDFERLCERFIRDHLKDMGMLP